MFRAVSILGVFGRRGLALAVIAIAGLGLGGLGSGASLAQTSPKAVYQEPLEGTYIVQGTNPNGSAYHGRVDVTVKGSTAFFRWQIGNDTYHGQGPVEGNTVVIDWGQADPVIYRINPDGSLAGTWARGRASEFLTKAR